MDRIGRDHPSQEVFQRDFGPFQGPISGRMIRLYKSGIYLKETIELVTTWDGNLSSFLIEGREGCRYRRTHDKGETKPLLYR